MCGIDSRGTFKFPLLDWEKIMSNWIPPSSPPSFELMTAAEFLEWFGQSDPLEKKWYDVEIRWNALRLNCSPTTGEAL